MSDDVIIRAENIGKRYTLNHQGSRGGYRKFSDTLIHAAKAPLRWLHPASFTPQPSQEDFWALKDINFEVKRGEVLGIIGRNGAGKSTLLKILSRITEPTTGRITLNGRVASLLEVGTGFHPELTGRENIYLNGAILGMHRAEIKAKFDEIVAFAEVEKFLDTPVKRYSSGMYVRLAFAVAAHLEPEILIVDEVLAVGDAQFQKKCLGKMQDVARKGRTVLFVSHNMGAVRSFCHSSILLNAGRMVAAGSTDSILALYAEIGRSVGQELKGIENNRGLSLTKIEIIETKSLAPQSALYFRESYQLVIVIHSKNAGLKAGVVVKIWNANEILVSTICGPEEGIALHEFAASETYRLDLPKISLLPGVYRIAVFVFSDEPEPLLTMENALSFEVCQAPISDGSASYRGDHGIYRAATSMTRATTFAL